MQSAQPAILAPLPASASYLFFRRLSDRDKALQTLIKLTPEQDLLALGASLWPALPDYPFFHNEQRQLPHTPADLLVWVRADDAGAAALRARYWQLQLADQFELTEKVDAFIYAGGRDLTGYEDGTENPEGQAAVDAALVQQGRQRGGSFLALQQWQHHWRAIDAKSREQMNLVIGRDQSSNEELAHAPLSAHVKRTEQESFNPPQFLLRRSMPWQQSGKMGLMFAAFGCSTAAFEAQMWRMLGRDDGIEDAVFSISSPVSGAYFYCPPLAGGKIIVD